MKKNIAIFLTLAMVFSLFSGFTGIKRTKAASVTITGLNTPDGVTGLPTYTFVDNPIITATVIFGTAVNSANPPAFKVTGPNATPVTGTLFPMGPNSAVLSFIVAAPLVTEGVYTLSIYTDATYTILLATQLIYIKYKVTLTVASPTPVYNQWSWISGTVLNNEGGVPAGTPLYFVSGSGVQTLATYSGGIFAFSNNFVSHGNYTLQGLLPTTYAHPAIYKTWALGGNLIIKGLLEPSSLCATGTYQEAYLYLGYSDGTPVPSSKVVFTPVSTGSAPNFVTWTPINDTTAPGFYKIAGLTPTVAGNNYYTIYVDGLTYNYNLYFKPAAATWNPTIILTQMNFNVGGTWQFLVSYNVAAPNVLHDQLTTLKGPLGTTTFAGLGGTDANGTANVVATVQNGGNIALTLNANLWDTTNALTATSTSLMQTFTVTPAIIGDLVTCATTSLEVGTTATITVNVETPAGIVRNNGTVILQSSVPGTFTVPTGALYRDLDGTGEAVILDAVVDNVNIVDGNYVFSGLKINHSGSVKILVYNGTTAIGSTAVESAALANAIYITPILNTLTSVPAKLVAGETYPILTLNNGEAGLTNWTEYDPNTGLWDLTPSYIDNGNGTYTFNFATGIPAWTTTGLQLRGSNATTPEVIYQALIPVVLPTLTFTSVHSDGLITNNLREKVSFTVTDPLTGTTMTPGTYSFVPQYSTWAITGNTNLQVSQFLTMDTSTIGATSSEYLKSTFGNANVDYNMTEATLGLILWCNGQRLDYGALLTVAASKITLSPSNLVLYYGQSNAFSVNALDAHGKGIEGVSINGYNPYQTYYSGYYFGGITGADGTVAFNYTPTYVGEIALVSEQLGLTVANKQQLILQIKAVPADTTAPVITLDALLDGQQVTTPNLTISGKVSEKVSTLLLNGDSVTVLPDNSFTTKVILTNGNNHFSFIAFDLSANKGTLDLAVNYKAPVDNTVTIILNIGSDMASITKQGKTTGINLDAIPEIKNARTAVPLRFIAEAFGGTVNWEPENQVINIVLGEKNLSLQVGNLTVVSEATRLSDLPFAPYIKNGRTMVPLRVIGEFLGANFVWTPSTQTITITYTA